MPSGGRPTVPRPWSSRVVHVAGPGLGRAVALQDRDADVFPGLLERRRQERARATGTAGSSPPSCAWTLRNRRRRSANGRCRATRAEAVEAAVRPRLSTSRSMALQNRSRTCGTTTIEVTRWSRSASKMTRGLRLRTYRMSAPTDRARRRGRPPARAGATAAAARRCRWSIGGTMRVERLDRGDDVVVAERHALRGAGRARGEDRARRSRRASGAPRPRLRLPVGRESVSSGSAGERLDGRRREAGRDRRRAGRRIAAGAEDQVARRGRGRRCPDRVGATSAGRAGR